MAEAEGGSKSKSIGLRVQKKLIGKMTSKKTAKILIDDELFVLIDELGALAALDKGEKFSEKLIKDLLKLVVKVAILMKNDQFSDEEVRTSLKFMQKLNALCMTLVSFHEVAFSYDRSFLVKGITDAHTLIKNLVSRHLTEKSIKRIDNVFGYFNGEFFDQLFGTGDNKFTSHLDRIATVLTKLMDEDKL